MSSTKSSDHGFYIEELKEDGLEPRVLDVAASSNPLGAEINAGNKYDKGVFLTPDQLDELADNLRRLAESLRSGRGPRPSPRPAADKRRLLDAVRRLKR